MLDVSKSFSFSSRLLTLLFCGLVTSEVQAQSMQEYADLKQNMVETHARFQAPNHVADNKANFDEITNNLRGVEYDLGAAEPGEISRIDFRGVVLQMSQSSGGNFRPIDIMNAQKLDTPIAITIENGAVDLEMLKNWAASQPDSHSILKDDVLRLPLLVSDTGRLTLNNNDVLKLSRQDGAFIANFGSLVIKNAQISSTKPNNSKVSNFRPFVTTLGTGRAHISKATFNGLGFGKLPEFAGISIINRGLYDAQGPSFLIDSVLQNVNQVMFGSTEYTIIRGNTFVGSQAGGLALEHTQRVKVVQNTFSDSSYRSALRVTDGSIGTTITDNVVMGSKSSGILIADGSTNTSVVRNIVWNSGGSGISVKDSDCIQVTDNSVIDNRRKGIEVRKSQGTKIFRNQLFGNRSSGLFLGAQPADSTTHVQDNTFAGNRNGISAASAEKIALNGNDFLHQFPRFLDGDLVDQSYKIIRDLEGQTNIILSEQGDNAPSSSPVTCRFGLEG